MSLLLYLILPPLEVVFSLSVSLLHARCVRYRRILVGTRRQLPHLHCCPMQHVRLCLLLVKSGGGWMVARMEGMLVGPSKPPPKRWFYYATHRAADYILGTKDPMDLRAAD